MAAGIRAATAAVAALAYRLNVGLLELQVARRWRCFDVASLASRLAPVRIDRIIRCTRHLRLKRRNYYDGKKNGRKASSCN